MGDAVYYMNLDIGRNFFSFNYNVGDISAKMIGTATWNLGMSDADQGFAGQSKLQFTVDNVDGDWNPDTLAAESLANGNFASWAAGNPSSWTVTGKVGTDPDVSQVSADQTHGGGTGACNLFASSGTVSISQLTLPIRTSYQVQLDISAAQNNTGYVAVYYGAVRISPYYHFTGSYTFYFNTDNVSGAFTIQATGPVDMTIDTVSLKQTSVYGKLVDKGMFCRWGIVTGGFTYYQFVGRLDTIDYNPGAYGRRTVTLTFVDPLYDYLDIEYVPPLYTNTTADVPLAAIMESGLVPFPYAQSYWLLGVQGSSELDLTTTLYNPPSYSFETGVSTFAWVGDNTIDSPKTGASAQSFMRDLVDGEIYGRFFYYPYLGGFVFQNRQHDALNKTVQYTLTSDDYEPELSNFTKTQVVNQCTVAYQPRTAGAADSVLWSQPSIGQGNITNKFTIRYRDATNNEARIGAAFVIPPLAGTDYIATEYQGTADLTSYIVVSVKPGANSAEMTITNTSPKIVVISPIQLRGTPLTTFTPSSVTSTNNDSIYKYQLAPERLSYRLVDTQIFAQSIADFRVYRNGTSYPVFDKLGYYKDKTLTRLQHSLLNPIGDRITVQDTFLNHSADYFIVGYRHTVVFGGDGTHTVIYTLKPAAKESFWILDTSALGIDTQLGL